MLACSLVALWALFGVGVGVGMGVGVGVGVGGESGDDADGLGFGYASGGNTCENARLRCAYRTGCGRALQSYMVGCSGSLRLPSGVCPENCQHALIALTSTEEGKALMECECGDEYCEETKQRAEVCRPHVERATLNETVVSCRVAQWICKADAICSTALDYYHRFCRSMFQGKRCSRRCINSISILRRQEKAAKLISCRCDGREDYDCAQIRVYMERLCFPGQHKEGAGDAAPDAASLPPHDDAPPRAPAPPRSGAATPSPPAPALALAPCLVLLLLASLLLLLPTTFAIGER